MEHSSIISRDLDRDYFIRARTYTRGNSPNLGHFSRDLGQNLRVTFVIAPRFGQFSDIDKGTCGFLRKRFS